MNEKEKQNIEWKEIWKDDYLNWICSFANAQGGKLYIGIDDRGNIIGVKDIHKLLEILPSKIRDTMGIVLDINLLKKDGREYIEIIVPEYPIAISCKGSYFYRSGSTTQKLTGIELESFILRKRGATWDNIPHPQVLIEDLDERAIGEFRNLASNKNRIDSSVLNEKAEILLDKLHLINHDYLTNAALLLFSKDPEKYFTGAFIKVGFFENDADLLYQDEVRGSLFEQVNKTIELIYFKYMKAKISYEGIQRVERYFVTKDSMREALLNAVVHKQYESGIPIQISVYKDKLYIGNVGKLPDNWTVENLYRKHNSKPYNPNIAHVFYLAGQIESWGRGIEKICNSCKDNMLPLPIYHINPTDIMIQFDASKELIIDNFSKVTDNDGIIEKVTEKVTDNDGIIEKVTDKVTDNDGIIEKVTEKVTDNEETIKKVTDKVTDNEKTTKKVTDKQSDVLNLLIEDSEVTTEFIAKSLEINRKTVSLRLKELKEKGIVERVGSDRKGYWRIRK